MLALPPATNSPSSAILHDDRNSMYIANHVITNFHDLQPMYLVLGYLSFPFQPHSLFLPLDIEAHSQTLKLPRPVILYIPALKRTN
ncbi:hypothetical protein BPAE_0048g00010 [Botrytis paeoniae]|uniref:Uncharacterized protein n=1 Tax=Botrytis paeoniae TaxID=278948 RepID=A0A4Z1FUQ6_9HELO|nr:hypothetical protein BPAE_0048g00010 [Botrytis paeoniae]